MKKFRHTNEPAHAKSKSVSAILSAWGNDVSAAVIVKQKQLTSRRMFLGQSVGLVSAVAMPAYVSAKMKNAQVEKYEVENNILTQPWLTLAEVQEHLFPRTVEVKHNKKNNDFSPGAKDINAIGYLYTMLHTTDADVDERKFILKGVSWLDGMADTMVGAPFTKLDTQDRERVLKKICASDTGETWLSTLLRYIFEALLTDPVYGGNTGSKGWQWLEHQPGFPRPPENKMYWLLDGKKSEKPFAIKSAAINSGEAK